MLPLPVGLESKFLCLLCEHGLLFKFNRVLDKFDEGIWSFVYTSVSKVSNPSESRPLLPTQTIVTKLTGIWGQVLRGLS